MNDIQNNTIVMLLDAGGTNFEFSAMQHGKEIVAPVKKHSNAHDLKLCLKTMVDGFNEVKEQLIEEPQAISFAFPGPADYPNGIIGDLPNLPAFRGGIALGPYLKEQFGVPVFINNDGDLFAYGEAKAGILPKVNQKLCETGNSKQYKNLIGLTLGTGFGCGLINNGNLLQGDNSIAAEVWLLSSRVNADFNAEEIVSTRSIIAEYAKVSNTNTKQLLPYDIAQIALGKKNGNMEAAKSAFRFFGRGIGDAMANLITLMDSIVVLGCGITGAKELYMPALIQELTHRFENRRGDGLHRTIQQVYNYNLETERNEFLKIESKKITIPGSEKTLDFNFKAKLAICHSEIGASKAIQLGAYNFALQNL